MNSIFDISKLPDIYDCIKYDLLHNKSTMQCQATEELYTYAKSMADIVIPQVLLKILKAFARYFNLNEIDF